MSQPLAPTYQVQIPTNTHSRTAFPVVQFDQSSQTLVVSRWTSRWDAQPWLQRYQGDISGIAAVLVALTLLLITRRVMGSPQETGHLYCRRCNYDLTPPEAAASSAQTVCSECGITLTAAPPRRGKRRPVRLILPILTFLPLLALCIHSASIDITSAQPGSTSWPFEFCGRLIPSWPLARKDRSTDAVEAINVFPLHSDPGSEGKAFLAGNMYTGKPSPDGRYFVWHDFGLNNEWNNEIVIRDVHANLDRRIFIGTNTDGFGQLHGFTPDGKEAIATITGLVSDQAGTTPVRIIAINLQSGDIRKIGEAATLAKGQGTGSWQISRIAVAVRDHSDLEPDPSWAMLTLDGPAIDQLTLGTSGGNQTRMVTPATALFKRPAQILKEGLELDPDGSLRLDQIIQIAADGKATSLVVPPAEPWTVDFTTAPPSLINNGNTLATLDLDSAPYNMSGAIFSPDGRWCAVTLVDTNATATTYATIRIWDLSAISK